MAKQQKPLKSGFIIKLSCETVQKLNEEDQSKDKNPQETVTEQQSDGNCNKSSKIASDKSESPVTTNLEKDEFVVSSNQTLNANLKSVQKSPVVSVKEKEEAIKNDKAATTSDTSKDSADWGDYAPYITYEGEEAIYTDPSNQQKYCWSKENNSWEVKSGQVELPGREYSYEDDTHVYTEPDGSKFFWDEEKKAWLPKVDDDFLAFYQMSYGFVDNNPKEVENKDGDKKESNKKNDNVGGVKRKSEPQWFEASDDTNTKVYVSNLPQDITEEEFVNFMQKCGLVERDPSSQKMKVKLYMDKEHNCFKGDALCTYIKIESVDLALKLLDGSDFKGNKIKVERAHFQLKGEYNPSLKPKKKKKKELEKIKKMQQKLFDWRPEKFMGERSKHERVVIIKNLFHPSDFDKDVQLILDYQQDLREECSKAGEVRKVVIYDRHPEGVAQVTMKEPEMADAAVELINGRWFGKRQITAEIWDGRTKYRIAETDADISKRIDKWDKFLEGKEKEDDNKTEGKDTKPGTETIPTEQESTSTLPKPNETVTVAQEQESTLPKPNETVV